MTSRGHDPTRLNSLRSHRGDHDNSGIAGWHSHGAQSTRHLNAQSCNDAVDLFPKGDRYQRLGEPIAGGMGLVFRALDSTLNIEVAIKRIRPEFRCQQDLLNRFEREAKAQVRLRHPNLVVVRDFVQDSVGPYIVMDWVNGHSLVESLRIEGPFAWERAADIIRKVATALQMAHDIGIIHRDIKPANILLDLHGEPFVTDFGLARVEGNQGPSSDTITGALLGTVDFVAPEQLKDPRSASVQSDIWSLGATLYQLVTGRSVRGMRESLIPEPLRDVVLTAMEDDPNARFRSMAEFAAALSRKCVPKLSVIAVDHASRGGRHEDSMDLLNLFRSIEQSNVPAKDMIAGIQRQAREAIELHSDYLAAIALLQRIPEKSRDMLLYEECRSNAERVAELSKLLAEKVAQLDYESICKLTLELLDLQPRRRDLIALFEEACSRKQGDELAVVLLRGPELPGGIAFSEVVFTGAVCDLEKGQALLGVSNGAQRYELRPTLSGRPIRWLVKPGSKFMAGDAIVTFECSKTGECQLEAREVTGKSRSAFHEENSIDLWEGTSRAGSLWNRFFGG